MFCKYCGKELLDEAVFCSGCGKQLLKKSIKNNNVKTSNRFVSTELQQKKRTKHIPIESSKSRLLASLLAFFFGNIGAHRFYVGKAFTGFIQLILGLSFTISLILLLTDRLEEAVVVCLVGIIWSFWTLIDFLMILCGAFKDKDGLPISDWGL